jgi:hypothetical protein
VLDATQNPGGGGAAGIGGQGQFDPGLGFILAPLLQKHPPVVDQALDVIGFDLQGVGEGFFGGVMIAGLPLTQTEHVITPGVGGMLIGVDAEHLGRLVIFAVEVGFFSLGVGDDTRFGGFDDNRFSVSGDFNRRFGLDGDRRFIHSGLCNGFGCRYLGSDDRFGGDDVIAAARGDTDADKNGEGQDQDKQHTGLGDFHLAIPIGGELPLFHGGLLLLCDAARACGLPRCWRSYPDSARSRPVEKLIQINLNNFITIGYVVKKRVAYLSRV